MRHPRNHAGRSRIAPATPGGRLAGGMPPAPAETNPDGFPTLDYFRPPLLPDQGPALGELAWVVWPVVGIFVLGLLLAAVSSVVA